MSKYCVNSNAQANGDHEVHNLETGTWCLPDVRNRIDLGEHPSCVSAVAAARSYVSKPNGCAYCAPECHTT